MQLLGQGGNWWSVRWGHPVCDQLREALGVEVRDVARARVDPRMAGAISEIVV